MNDETPNSFRIWQKFQRKINFRYNLVFELFQKVGMYSLFEFLRLGNLRMSINFFENEMTIFKMLVKKNHCFRYLTQEMNIKQKGENIFHGNPSYQVVKVVSNVRRPV